jgi:serine protease Do
MPNSNTGFLGVGLADAEGAARIAEVSPKSPAAKAGLKKGDLVLKVAGSKITSSDSMVALIQRFKVGKTITLEIKRGTEVKELKATLEKRPKEIFNRADFQNTMGSVLSNRRGGFPVILQHDQVLKPTDCGGPVVDLDGKAVGINIARAGRVESYALPTEAVLALLDPLKSGKLAPKEEPAVPALTALEMELKKLQDELAASEKALKALEEAQRNSERKKKELESALAATRKKVADAEAALKKAKDSTKKE